MKSFWIVLKYELKEYFTSKGFVAFTLLLAIGGIILSFLPRFIDMSDFTGVGVNEETVEEDRESKEDKEEWDRLYLYDEAGITDMEILKQFFPETEWVIAETTDVLKQAVEEQEAEAGFVVTAADSYDYYVYNKGMYDGNSAMFDEAMKVFYRISYCEEHNLDYAEITGMLEAPITVNEQILGKDTQSNYWYCYMLVILVFMLIVLYGQMIAVSITSEKSNRAIEVLVTSTSPNSLLFGKVIAGAIGGLVQSGIILGSILIAYQFNRAQWGGSLDMLFHIPAQVLVTFAFFGLGGYLFYAFLFGAVGALVSKTEDISKSSGGLMTIIMIVYFFSLIQLANIDGPVIKVLSFLPVSSYSTMFARIAMGSVSSVEIVISFLILAASIVGVGVLGAKLYRMGTLRYGNPIKLSAALKSIRKSE
ncbi:MAG: ABC transporter permease [Lachnospiraceae bacterium]|nr:ABC transporter permease [Lachnospiraceae bacterium]